MRRATLSHRYRLLPGGQGGAGASRLAPGHARLERNKGWQTRMTPDRANFVAERAIRPERIFTQRSALDGAEESCLFDRQTTGKAVFLF